jgi:hypothetical protein
MKPEDLIKWNVVSRFLSGSRETVRKNAIPKIHQAFLKELFEEMSKVIEKYLANPEKYHPHHRVIIDSANAELLDGKQSTGQTLDYIPD